MCLYVFALLLPPVAVLLKHGCGCAFFLNILLTILGWLPGVVHAWYIIGKYSTPSHRHAYRERRVVRRY